LNPYRSRVGVTFFLCPVVFLRGPVANLADPTS
jgi:hypothetical protein